MPPLVFDLEICSTCRINSFGDKLGCPCNVTVESWGVTDTYNVRCWKISKDVFRWSQMFLNLLQMFSRCSLDVFYIFKGKERYLEKFIFSSVSVGHRTKNQKGAIFISKISFLWHGLLNQPLQWDAISDSISSTSATAQLSNDKHIFSVPKGQSCQFSIWVMKITRLRKSIFLPTFLWS